MKNHRTVISKAPLLLLGAMLLAAPAQSRTVGASAGAAYTPSQASCVDRSGIYTRVSTQAGSPGCSQMYWNTDVENHETSAISHGFWAYGQSANTTACPLNPSLCQTTCAAIIVQPNGALSQWTGHIALNTTPSWRALGTLTVDASQNQGIQFECSLRQGGYVSSFRGF